MATMQNKITDFDGAIESINTALKISPNDLGILKQKITILSLISRLPAEGQMYFNDQTREAFKIEYYTSKDKLLEDLIDSIITASSHEKANPRELYRNLWKLAVNSRELKRFSQAIDYLNKAIDSIPARYQGVKRDKECANIYREISTNYAGLLDYQNSIKYMDKAFELGLDDYYRILLHDIYFQFGKKDKAFEVLRDLISRINKKLTVAPEPAFISQKVKVLKLLSDTNGLKSVLKDFDVLEPLNEYAIQVKQKLELEIKNYLQQIRN